MKNNLRTRQETGREDMLESSEKLRTSSLAAAKAAVCKDANHLHDLSEFDPGTPPASMSQAIHQGQRSFLESSSATSPVFGSPGANSGFSYALNAFGEQETDLPSRCSALSPRRIWMKCQSGSAPLPADLLATQTLPEGLTHLPCLRSRDGRPCEAKIHSPTRMPVKCPMPNPKAFRASLMA
eukprot:scaffold259953_cov42-Prasinocladus_malaysianus.AAC.1